MKFLTLPLEGETDKILGSDDDVIFWTGDTRIFPKKVKVVTHVWPACRVVKIRHLAWIRLSGAIFGLLWCMSLGEVKVQCIPSVGLIVARVAVMILYIQIKFGNWRLVSMQPFDKPRWIGYCCSTTQNASKRDLSGGVEMLSPFRQ
jgi:hypothetical protein